MNSKQFVKVGKTIKHSLSLVVAVAEVVVVFRKVKGDFKRKPKVKGQKAKLGDLPVTVPLASVPRAIPNPYIPHSKPWLAQEWMKMGRTGA